MIYQLIDLLISVLDQPPIISVVMSNHSSSQVIIYLSNTYLKKAAQCHSHKH